MSFRIDTNTERFAAALENTSSYSSFYFCITGVPAGQTAKSVLAYFRFKAENRPSSSVGAPDSSDPEYLNSQEVQALVKSTPVFEFSEDGATDWHSAQIAADRYYREQRNGGEWSDAIALVEPTDAFVYVAYASDDEGTDFNLTPSDTLKYRAEIHVTEEIAAPVLADFAGATWVKYIGDSITGPIGLTGPAGQDAFVYVAYASDNSGTDWNLTPSDSLKYRAEIHSITELTPVESDFAAATWVKYLGDNADGTTPQGEYNSGTTYILNNGVTYNGSYYRSLADANTGNQPDSSPTYWELTVEKGDTGATGPEVKHIIKDVSALASGTVTLDAYKDIYTITVAADTTFTFDASNLGDLTDKVVTFELHIDMTTVSTITFPDSVSWIDEPLMNVTGVYILTFRTIDGGTTWRGNLADEVLL